MSTILTTLLIATPVPIVFIAGMLWREHRARQVKRSNERWRQVWEDDEPSSNGL